jgi:hypothetical protein
MAIAPFALALDNVSALKSGTAVPPILTFAFGTLNMLLVFVFWNDGIEALLLFHSQGGGGVVT